MYYYNFEDEVVQYCRGVFKNKYNNYWIDTIDLEEEEVKNKLKLVEIDLYPKHINLREELRKQGIKPPPRLNIKEPKKPNKKKYRSDEKYKKALSEYNRKLNKYNELKEQNRKNWEKFKSIVYTLIHDDIDYSKDQCIDPIEVTIKKIFVKGRRKPIIKIYEN